MNKIIIAAGIALIIGGGGGYALGKNSAGTQKGDTKLQDAIAMMQDQSSSIRQMSDMMKSGGLMMEEMGVKYKDDKLVEEGKDMQAIGERNQSSNEMRASEGSMQQMMH